MSSEDIALFLAESRYLKIALSSDYWLYAVINGQLQNRDSVRPSRYGFLSSLPYA
jgi:hypothetical protein